MAWIKRNLYFVITLVVGLAVTGFCGYKLYAALDQNKTDSTKYSSDKSQLESLQKKSPYPDKDNIQAAQSDSERVRSFLNEFHKPFASFPPPPKLDDQQFKDYLQKIVARFGAEATNAGVGLPPSYRFSFGSQLDALNYPSDSIGPWLQELTEMEPILQILYKAKINYLVKIKRPVIAGEPIMGDDYTSTGTVTNTASGMVKTPYMVNFRAFSPEIANVLAGIAASSNCFIVKTIYVSPSREPLPQIAEPPPPPPPPVQMRQFQYPQPEAPVNPFATGGPGGRFRERRPPPMEYQQAYQQAQAPPPPAGPVNVITETPLFVTLYIDVVKLKAPEPPPPAAPAPGVMPRTPRTRRAGG